MAAKATEKESKGAVNYSAGMKDRHCGICRFFNAPHGCAKVSGSIDPAMWCKRFKVRP